MQTINWDDGVGHVLSMVARMMQTERNPVISQWPCSPTVRPIGAGVCAVVEVPDAESMKINVRVEDYDEMAGTQDFYYGNAVLLALDDLKEMSSKDISFLLQAQTAQAEVSRDRQRASDPSLEERVRTLEQWQKGIQKERDEWTRLIAS